uniref:Secreted protein n=1 Tax=Steinernema glaseri TaxID=37863 RepID=A0A1I8AFS3_9BILA
MTRQPWIFFLYAASFQRPLDVISSSLYMSPVMIEVGDRSRYTPRKEEWNNGPISKSSRYQKSSTLAPKILSCPQPKWQHSRGSNTCFPRGSAPSGLLMTSNFYYSNFDP